MDAIGSFFSSVAERVREGTAWTARVVRAFSQSHCVDAAPPLRFIAGADCRTDSEATSSSAS